MDNALKILKQALTTTPDPGLARSQKAFLLVFTWQKGYHPWSPHAANGQLVIYQKPLTWWHGNCLHASEHWHLWEKHNLVLVRMSGSDNLNASYLQNMNSHFSTGYSPDTCLDLTSRQNCKVTHSPNICLQIFTLSNPKSWMFVDTRFLHFFLGKRKPTQMQTLTSKPYSLLKLLC